VVSAAGGFGFFAVFARGRGSFGSDIAGRIGTDGGTESAGRVSNRPGVAATVSTGEVVGAAGIIG
jgi:hypothetical protein